MGSDYRKLLNEPTAIGEWLDRCRFTNRQLATGNLQSLVNLGRNGPSVADRLTQLLPVLPDPDLTLNGLEKIASSSQEIADKLIVLAKDEAHFSGLLRLLSHSRHFADLLRHPGNLDFLLENDTWTPSESQLIGFVDSELKSKNEFTSAQRSVRSFYQRHLLRIAWGDLVLGHHVDVVAKQLSTLATAVLSAATQWCRDRLDKKIGKPYSQPDHDCRYAILAMGKLGGDELNYSSDIDLVAMFEHAGSIQGGAVGSNQEYFGRLTRDIMRLVGEPTPDGSTWRIDLRLRPNGKAGPVCQSLRSMQQYYDLQGRTWERQALIKARPVAGDLSLAEEFLAKLQPWIFGRVLGRSDIIGIKQLKRKIERRAQLGGEDRTNIKTGYGGIRDVEFVIQFMQLLNGSEIESLRSPNTLMAIGHLERARCLTDDEAILLSANYRWLRTLEHRLQMMDNQQTHHLPENQSDLVCVARRMGFDHADARLTLEAFRRKLRDVTDQNRAILGHLLHGSLGASKVLSGSESESDVSEEAELVLDPDPDPNQVESVMKRWGFTDPVRQFPLLMELSAEKSRFISSRRCKHFFASIAQPLLQKISQTPDPNRTLTSLISVSDSLGARGVLWELFSTSPETLELYVRLCASSEYLAEILRSNPGMIDELLDALLLESLPDLKSLQSNIEELTRGVDRIDLSLASFKNTQHMRIGVRDILGKDTIVETHRTLADVADVCLSVILEHEFHQVWQKHRGAPFGFDFATVPFLVLGMGKLGGREPNYHSDLDVVFIYNSDGEFTAALGEPSPRSFFIALAAAITNRVGSQTSRLRLYEIDSRLRPLGSSGSLAVSFEEFARYFESGPARLWERQALCKARPVAGNAILGQQVMSFVRSVLAKPFTPAMAEEIWDMRLAVQKDARQENIKRGIGGTVDIEFLVQMLRMKAAHEHPSVLVPGTLAAIDQLEKASLLEAELAKFLRSRYKFLRTVESRLRLMNTSARHDLPTDHRQLETLALLMSYPSRGALVAEVDQTRGQVRATIHAVFSKIFSEK